MKALITGIRRVDFKDDEGRPVKGTSLYYKVKLEPNNGQFAGGYMTEKLWLREGSQLEAKLLSQDYNKPFEAELLFDILPGSKRPVLSDIAI